MQTRAHLVFGRGGNSLPYQRFGFGDPEDGFTWLVDLASELVFPLAAGMGDGAGEHLIELAVNPFVVPPALAAQRLVVLVNGVVAADESLCGQGVVGYRIPAAAWRSEGKMRVELRHPQAAQPSALGVGQDDRRLGFMLRSLRVIRVAATAPADITALPPLLVPADFAAAEAVVMAATGLLPRALCLCFESLGRNCEFGLVQRRAGAEPIGLLRFAGLSLDHLLEGLVTGFAGAGDEIVVRPGPHRHGKQEFMVCDDRFHISLHSFRTTDETTAEAVAAEHGQRLRFAARQFAHWLRTGERLFVVQRPGQLTRSQVRPLLLALRRFGPNSLLYVDDESDLPVGAVERLEHGLLHGRLDRFAPAEDAGDLNLPGWLSLCANAHRLWRAG